ncbi:MAG: hypothetical protein WAL25_05710 [Acidimicrobiia bacterium]
MNDPEQEQGDARGRQLGGLVPALAVLGGGIGAAVGTAMGNLGTGLWIGGAIGVGLGMLISFFMSR